MAKSMLTKQLEESLYLKANTIGVYCCFEVTVPIGGRERADFVTLDNQGIWRFYEIKASVSDFRSHAKHTFFGHYNYFVLTEEVYHEVKNEIPKPIGVIVRQQVVKRPQKQQLVLSESELQLAMIRSLSRTQENQEPVALQQELKQKNEELSEIKKLYRNEQMIWREKDKIARVKYGERWSHMSDEEYEKHFGSPD